jgi:hypothetical protein
MVSWRPVLLCVFLVSGCGGAPGASPPAAPAPASWWPASPGVVPTSPSATPQPSRSPGATCDEVLAEFTRQSGTPWRPSDDVSLQQQRKEAGKAGTRTCTATTRSSAQLPAALFSFHLLRANTEYQDAADVLRSGKQRAAENKCTAPVPRPPAGVVYAATCVERTDGFARVTELLVVQDGWSETSVHMDGKGKVAEDAAVRWAHLGAVLGLQVR